MTVSKLNIDPNKAAAVLCKRSLAFFVKEFWSVVVAEELVWSWHMDVLCEEMQAVLSNCFQQVDRATGRRYRNPKIYDLIINIPPGTSKSTICTIMAPAWAWACDPTQRFLTVSYANSLAIEHSGKSKSIVESDKYRVYFPDVAIVLDKSGKSNYENTKLGQRYAAGLESGITGIHATAIIIDDPLNAKEALSQAETDSANENIDGVLSQRKTDKKVTPTIMIMQRLAANDPTGYWLEKGLSNTRHVCLPAEDAPTVTPASLRERYIGGYLDPVRLGPEVLAEARIKLGAYKYAGQMEQQPAPAGGLIWQKWFREIADENFPSMQDCTQVGTDWDTAFTEKESNAASAFVTAGKRGKDCYIFDLGFDWLEMPELIKWMKVLKSPHYIEAKATGISAKQILQRSGVVAIEVPVKGGADKVARARNATPPVEAGFWYIRRSLADKLYNDPKQGILRFPKGQYKDLADALAQCVQRLSGTGIISANGGEKKTAASLVGSWT